MFPFEQFREGAKQALTFAGDEGASAGYIGTEHILIGLTRSGGPVRDLLADFGLDAKTVRALAATARHAHPSGPLIPTSRVKTVIELAFKISDGPVGGNELLLGILLEAAGIGAHLLDEAGVTLEVACERLGVEVERVRAVAHSGMYVATHDEPPATGVRGGAGWSGYAENTEVSEHRWRLRQPDGRGNTVEIEIQVPADYGAELRERITQEMLLGLQRALVSG